MAVYRRKKENVRVSSGNPIDMMADISIEPVQERGHHELSFMVGALLDEMMVAIALIKRKPKHGPGTWLPKEYAGFLLPGSRLQIVLSALCRFIPKERTAPCPKIICSPGMAVAICRKKVIGSGCLLCL